MRREDFLHVIQAASEIVHDELVVVGSQALLASVLRPPEAMARSNELDVFPRSDPERAIEIDGAIGEGSRFHETYGYYAHGVGPETIVAPAGWEERLERVDATLPRVRKKGGKAIGWCLSLPDLVLAKLAAGRPHDMEFVEAALVEGLVSVGDLRPGIDLMPPAAQRDVRDRLDGLAAKLGRVER